MKFKHKLIIFFNRVLKSPLGGFRGLLIFMYFTGKMKLNIRIIISFCIQEPFTLSQINRIAIFVFYFNKHIRQNIASWVFYNTDDYIWCVRNIW